MAFPVCVYFASFMEQINFFTQTHQYFFSIDIVPSKAPLSGLRSLKVSHISVSAPLSVCSQTFILSIIIKYYYNVTQVVLRWVGSNPYRKCSIFKL